MAGKKLYRLGMAAFGGIAPTYHIELLEKPTIVWDFHSLLLAIQMMFSFMLTDEKSSLKVCKHCGKAFLASRPNTVFCSGQCKNPYNVYKSRAKSEKETVLSIAAMRFGDDSELFEREKDDSFKGSIGNIYQSFAGEDIYPTLEEKAANLLYFVTKNHSFYDGNKRIAATMFLHFLDKNKTKTVPISLPKISY